MSECYRSRRSIWIISAVLGVYSTLSTQFVDDPGARASDRTTSDNTSGRASEPRGSWITVSTPTLQYACSVPMTDMVVTGALENIRSVATTQDRTRQDMGSTDLPIVCAGKPGQTRPGTKKKTNPGTNPETREVHVPVRSRERPQRFREIFGGLCADRLLPQEHAHSLMFGRVTESIYYANCTT